MSDTKAGDQSNGERRKPVPIGIVEIVLVGLLLYLAFQFLNFAQRFSQRHADAYNLKILPISFSSFPCSSDHLLSPSSHHRSLLH